MSFRINTNVASLQSQEYLRQTSELQGKTIGRVTSGLRILSSGDDAAGLSIANTLRSDQAVLSQGIRNANDGLSTLQTLDGGINNISKLLDRARTLATQSASGTFSGSRTVLDSEFQSVVSEIDRQAQAIGLNAGGAFAKSLSVFIGGGRGSGSTNATVNGSVGVNLSHSTVDSRSLGLQGVQAQGVASIDIGTGSASTSVAAIVGDAANVASLANAGATEFYFRGPGFGDDGRVKVSVNLTGITDTGTLVAGINAAIENAGNAASSQATAFKNAGVRAVVATSATGAKSIGFTSSNTAFQVAAGDRLANALIGNVTSSSNPTGLTLTNTVTGGNATAAAATAFLASGAGTVLVRFQGAGLASPVDISLTVATGTTIDAAIANLSSQVATNGSLQAAGIALSTATAGSALVFSGNRGERFEVLSSGDLNNRLGLGSFRSSGGASGAFDYTTVTGSGGTFAVTPEILEFSLGGGAIFSISAVPQANNLAGARIGLNAAIAQISALTAAGLVVTDDGANLIVSSVNSTKFRVNTINNTNTFGFNAAGATGVVDAVDAQAGNTSINSFIASGSRQTSLLAFTAIRNGGDDQTISLVANDANGVEHSLAVVLRNDGTLRNAGTVDEAIDAINSALLQSNDTTLQKIVAVKDKATPSGAEGIRFASTVSSFQVAIGTNEAGTGIGNQGTVVAAATAGSGATADINTQAGAERAVDAIAIAVNTLGNAQAVVGRGQNQFNYAVNLAQSQITNLAASESRIRDADLAEEAASLTKAQILLEAGISALAQANFAPQQVLALLDV